MSGEISVRFASQAQLDIRRITAELADQQRQIASGARANDLQGFGAASGRLLNARSLRSNVDARASILNELNARLGVQSSALGQVADASRSLALGIRQAISANDGRGVATELSMTFASVVNALNENWNGQPLFAGERQGGGPIRIASLDELLTATTPAALYNEAARSQVVDIGESLPIVASPKASAISEELFDAMRSLHQMIVNVGGSLGQPIAGPQETMLLEFADTFDAQATAFNNEEGRSGQLQKKLEDEQVRLGERSDLLTKVIGDYADADLGEVSIRISALTAQYEAAAKTFVDLSRLSLLNFLR